MFHNSEKINIQLTPFRPETNDIKYHGSYIHFVASNCISKKPQLQRHVYKTRAKHPPKNIRLTNPVKYLHDDQKLKDANFDGTLKIIQLDIYQKITKTFLRLHYRSYLKRYLSKIYSMPAFMVPAEAFEGMRRTQIHKAEDSQFQSKVLCLFKPLFKENITSILEDKSGNTSLKSLKSKSLSRIAIQLVACAIEGGGLDNFFMTTDNVYRHKDMLVINYTSITGIPLVNCQQPILKVELDEIYPYLTQYIYEKGTRIKMQTNQQNGDYQENWKQIQHFRVRSILIILLSVILETNIFDIQIQDRNGYIKFQEVEKYIKELPSKFKSLLEKQQNINKIDNAQEQLKQDKSLAYQDGTLSRLFTKVLVDNHPVTYHQILSPFTIKRQQQNLEKDRIFKTLHDLLFDKQTKQQKQFYQSRNLNQMELFIPVKYGKDLSKLIATEYWWDSLDDTKCRVKQQFISIVIGELLFYDDQDDRDKQLSNQFKQYLKLSNLQWRKPSKQFLMDHKQQLNELKQYFINKGYIEKVGKQQGSKSQAQKM